MLKKDSLKPPTTRLNTEPFAQGASWNRKSSPPSPQVTNRAARAYCAFDGRTKVTDEDVGKAGRKVMIVGGGNFLPETIPASLPLKIGVRAPWKRKFRNWNPPFLGAFAVSFRECICNRCIYVSVDSKRPFDPLVGGHLTFERVTFSPSQKGHKELPGIWVYTYTI